jgi:hypothetical protein
LDKFKGWCKEFRLFLKKEVIFLGKGLINVCQDLERSSMVLKGNNSTKRAIHKFSGPFKIAFERGEKHLLKERKKFGGTPLPWEPGGEEFFEKVEEKSD